MAWARVVGFVSLNAASHAFSVGQLLQGFAKIICELDMVAGGGARGPRASDKVAVAALACDDIGGPWGAAWERALLRW